MTNVRQLLACQHCLQSAFDRNYCMYTATWCVWLMRSGSPALHSLFCQVEARLVRSNESSGVRCSLRLVSYDAASAPAIRGCCVLVLTTVNLRRRHRMNCEGHGAALVDDPTLHWMATAPDGTVSEHLF